MSKRIVLDCNLLVSALIRFDSTPGKAFDFARKNFELVISEPVFAELSEVLRRKKLARYFSREEVDLFLEVFRNAATIIETTEPITDCRDPKDNKYLELAVAAHAQLIVSGDLDLLELHPFRGISILTARAFLELHVQV